MNSEIIRQYSGIFGTGGSLAADDAEMLFDAMITETDEALLAALLANWEEKGVDADELFALAGIMRSRMRRITPRNGDVIDIVGTGGSRAKTFNVSTAAAFVAAGAGLQVAKHGNRAATSSSGSADVLADLGIRADISPETSQMCLDEYGICFMFAPVFHSLSPALARARKDLGRPTIFNNLGPLCNPAGAQFKMIGVWNHSLIEKTASVLARLGVKRAWVVHGEAGLDEIALSGRTFVTEVSGSDLTPMTIEPADFGIASEAGVLPISVPAEESAGLIRDILMNELAGGDAEKLVLINAAAAVYIAGEASDLKSAYEIALESVRSRNALGKLTALAAATNR